MSTFLRRGAVVTWLLATLIAITSGCGRVREKVRIATNQSPPFNFFDASGKPAGFAIDVLEEAAKRTNIELEWVFMPGSLPEEAFASGRADLWPVITYIESRKENLHMTTPWWQLATTVYFREDSGIATEQDLIDKKIVVATHSRRFQPGIRSRPRALQVYEDAVESLAAICSKEHDAVIMDVQVAESILLKRPAACYGVQLASLYLPDAPREFSIGARFGYESAADRLRNAIDDLATDGVMTSLAAKWKFVNAADRSLISWLGKAKERSHRMETMLLTLLAVLAMAIAALATMQIARRKAESHAAARARFLAHMSHEIRTPMNGILGMTELTLATPLTREQLEYLQTAHDAGRQLLHILDDILELSRAESGKVVIESIPANLQELAHRSVLAVSLRAAAKGIDLREEYAPDLPPYVICDPTRIQQVLTNLLSNAVKFTNAGWVQLRVSREPSTTADRGEDRILFEVRDSGIGIEPSAQKTIFDAFAQADSSTTRKFGGSGLGLAISSNLVRLMNGTLSVESAPQVGSTFRFSLRMPEATPPPEPVPAAPTPAAVKPLRVLVAEDNAVNSLLAQKILTSAGHEAYAVTDGKQAVAAFQKLNFDLVLMDVNMPEMDGFEATRRIRESGSKGSRVPIIALTALAIKGDKERCLAAGMNAYISKPFRRDELLAAVASYWMERQSQN